VWALNQATQCQPFDRPAKRSTFVVGPETISRSPGKIRVCDLEEEAVKADEVALQTLLRNLVCNAKSCTPDAGSIRIATTQDEGNPLLGVENSGIGIPCSEREHVLWRFYRGAGQAGTGVGLGLAIAAGIADAHRATMWLRDSCFGGPRVELRFATMT